MNGWTPEQADVERYSAAIEKVAVKDLIMPGAAKGHRGFATNYNQKFGKGIETPDERKYEMERIAKALYEAYERYYRK